MAKKGAIMNETLLYQASILNEHITIMRKQSEEQEKEMRELQESFEDGCRNQKELEDRLSDANDLIVRYETKIRDMEDVLLEKEEVFERCVVVYIVVLYSTDFIKSNAQ